MLFLCLIAGAYIVAWAFSRATEVQTHRFRRAMLGLMVMRKAPKSV
jgi:hypothetical protein